MTRTRKPLVSGNWKMHHDHHEALVTVQKLSYLLDASDYDAVDVSVHPPFTDLRTVQTWFLNERVAVALGAQDCHPEDKGAFTGQVSAAFLAKLEVRYVIVGHSERRRLAGLTAAAAGPGAGTLDCGEGDELVNAKVKAVLRHAMTPILCVGETLEERESGTTEAKVAGQVRAGLAGVAPDEVAAMVVAYEPIWAIGTGRTATAQDAQTVCALVRSTVADVAGEDAAASLRVQYGGSVKAENAAELMAQPDVDGALVGGASLDPESFVAIIRSVAGP